MLKYLIAFGVGAVTGILLAPYKGVETRRRITQTKNKVTRFIHDIPEKIDEQVANVTEKIENAAAAVDNKIAGSMYAENQ